MPISQAVGDSGRAAWMAGRVGLFEHALPWADDFERLDRFDAMGLAAQVANSGAAWFILTLGQNTNYYIAPNDTYERIAGVPPHSRCSRRDIPGEVAAALRGSGVRFGLYVPAQPSFRDQAAGDRFGFGKRSRAIGAGASGRDRAITQEAARNWASVVEEWSRRHAGEVSLWWFDGCYPVCGFDDSVARLYKDAALSGNPGSVVAFNAGVLRDGPETCSDYYGGEVNDPLSLPPQNGRLDARGRQRHVLTYLGRDWYDGVMRFEDAPLRRWLAAATATGCAVTLDVAPVRPSWMLDPEQLAQFRRVLSDGGLEAASPFRSEGEVLPDGRRRFVWSCGVCGEKHDIIAPAGATTPREPPDRCLRFAPVTRVTIDGRDVALPRGEGVLDLAALFPGEAQKGRDGGRAVEIAFSLDVPEGGLHRAFRHNDYYGALSVNGGPFTAADGPFAGWEPTPLALRPGRNTLRYRTRAGSAGKWTWGFGIERRGAEASVRA